MPSEPIRTERKEIRRVDFLELFPIQDGGWPYHTPDGDRDFANFLLDQQVPAEVDSALAQIDEYAEWSSQEAHRTWLEKGPALFLVRSLPRR